MFSLTLQMVQNIVEAASHQTELLSWGQELRAASCNTQGSYFCGEKPLQTLSVQGCVLGQAAKVSVLGASLGAECRAGPRSVCRQLFSHTALPWLTLTVLSAASKVKLQIRLLHKPGFSSGLKVPQAWGTHQEVHTKGFQGSCNGNQIVFPRNMLHSVIIFILLKSKLNFQPS